MKRLLILQMLLLALWLVGCTGKKEPNIENAYEDRVKDFTHMGVKAMDEERWKPAEHAFSRALQMSQLLGDSALEVRSWYNLAMSYKAMGDLNKSNDALQHAFDMARTHALRVSAKRAQIQLALLHIHHNQKKWLAPTFEKGWPADLYLSLAKLLEIQKNLAGAKQAYLQVLAAADKKKSGLLIQGQAMMGLALLARQANDADQTIDWAKKSLVLYRKVGAPRLTAHALLLLAGMQQIPVVKRMDDAKRAKVIYNILQDKDGQMKVEHMLETLALMEVK